MQMFHELDSLRSRIVSTVIVLCCSKEAFENFRRLGDALSNLAEAWVSENHSMAFAALLNLGFLGVSVSLNALEAFRRTRRLHRSD